MSRALAVLFDVDGTLITSGGAGAESWKLAFDELYGVPADIGEFTDNGMTDPEVGRRTFAQVVGHEPDGEEMARLMATRMRYLPGTVKESEGYRVLPGVRETLERLQAQGVLLGLCSGGTEEAVEVKLARGDLNRYFDFGGFGSDSEDRVVLTRGAVVRAEARLERRLSREEVLVVGDTPHDIDAAAGAGAGSVGVATGHYDAAALERAGADHVIGSLEEELPL